MSYGFVYILGNPSFPSIFKIGMTERSPSLRCKELSGSTAAPSAFVLLAYYEFEDARSVEQELHAWLDKYRVSSNREFFEVNLYAISEEVQHWGPLSMYESYMVEIAGKGGDPLAKKTKALTVTLRD